MTMSLMQDLNVDPNKTQRRHSMIGFYNIRSSPLLTGDRRRSVMKRRTARHSMLPFTWAATNIPLLAMVLAGVIVVPTFLNDPASRTAPCFCHGSSPSSSSSASLVLRLRLGDGSMEKIQIAAGKEDSMTLKDILYPFDVPEDASITVGNSLLQSGSGTTTTSSSSNISLKDLGIRHGSIVTVLPTTQTETTSPPAKPKGSVSRFSRVKSDPQKMEWNPYPDLAKNYEHALLKTKTRRSSQQGMSYGDIAQLQSALHRVEPQREGPLQRVYICRIAAERFHANGIVPTKGTAKPEISCRVGLLLGTIQKERADPLHRPKKARTSLSSTTSDSEYCTVAKVQALWEPPGQQSASSNKLYDAAKGQKLLSDYPRVLAIAGHLGIVPVGWIFSYQDDRLQQDTRQDKEPQALLGMDVATGAALQIQNMKNLGRSEGNKFVTLSMDAITGATEAFQLSDVTIQMVHENMFESLIPPPPPVVTYSEKTNPRTVTMRHAVMVDSRETTQLESVLCLINTAMLSNAGNYAGKTVSSVKKSNGSLTNKAKKSILRALEADEDRVLFEELCDFNILVALDQLLSETDMERLCGLVKKWARGQKQGTTIDSKLKLKLKSVLAS